MLAPDGLGTRGAADAVSGDGGRARRAVTRGWNRPGGNLMGLRRDDGRRRWTHLSAAALLALGGCRGTPAAPSPPGAAGPPGVHHLRGRGGRAGSRGLRGDCSLPELRHRRHRHSRVQGHDSGRRAGRAVDGDARGRPVQVRGLSRTASFTRPSAGRGGSGSRKLGIRRGWWVRRTRSIGAR